MVISIAFGFNYFFIISFLEVLPHYNCFTALNVKYECKPEDFCGTDIVHEVDWNNPESLHNWVETLDMACATKIQVSFLGSGFFMGWVFALLIAPRIAD